MSEPELKLTGNVLKVLPGFIIFWGFYTAWLCDLSPTFTVLNRLLDESFRSMPE